jgi:hypothetical protein
MSASSELDIRQGPKLRHGRPAIPVAGTELEVPARETFSASTRVLDTPEAECVLTGHEERNCLLVPIVYPAPGRRARLPYDGSICTRRPSSRAQRAEASGSRGGNE